MEEEVKIPGKRGPLEGNLHLPEGVEKPPVVIIAHGLFGGKDAPHRLSTVKALVENGFAALRFNFSAGSHKDKVFDEVLTPQVEDLESALDFLEKRKDVDHDRVGVFAGSMSGAASFLLAAKDKRVKALVSLASFHNPLDMLTRYPKMVTHSKGGSSLRVPAGGRVRFTDKFILDLHNHNVPEAIRNVKQPVLFLHGDEDRTIPVDHAQRLHEEKPGEKELHIFHSRHHGYSNAEDQELVNRHTLEWFQRWLKKE